MDVTLSPESRKFLDDKVRAGYGTADAVVESALRLWRESEHAERVSGDELVRLIAVGQAEADRGELLDGRSVFAEIRRHSAALRGA